MQFYKDQKQFMLFKLVTIVFYLFFSARAEAAIYTKCITTDSSLYDSESVELDLKRFENLAKEDRFDSKDVQLFIPTNIPNHANGELIQKKLMDQSLNSLLKGKIAPNNSVVQNARALEKSMQYEMAFQPENSKYNHKFNVQYQIFQQAVKLKYSGYVDANFSLSNAENNVNAEIAKKITKGSSLVYAYNERNISSNTKEELQMLSMRWNY